MIIDSALSRVRFPLRSVAPAAAKAATRRTSVGGAAGLPSHRRYSVDMLRNNLSGEPHFEKDKNSGDAIMLRAAWTDSTPASKCWRPAASTHVQ
ncbi:hypothetical protein BJD99_14620 [Rhodococcus sp. 1163]|uniref:hypothetical protein n=1 Tax=unclassified Rhodococcus (in: high G+C Gram-positive bacteria) TaxID=192944 RepID=UPI000A096F63|nr:hypothetical protein [Rhodococcus sp. 1163]ORI17930.1 hypothetical protein BJD99_14620 [Rhodococcus sp. 1163]